MREVVDVTDWSVVVVEADGSTPNVWVRDPATKLRWLFKPATDSKTRLQVRDWVEVVVAAIAGRLSVPAAEVVLATRNGARGSLTRHLVDDEHSGRQLQPGSVLLATLYEDFVGFDEDDVRANVPGHSLVNIASALEAVGPPPGGVDGDSAFNHFAGYLVLDALVANTDRHARNWGLLGQTLAGAQLAPSFDHGSSLGFQLDDSQRQTKMAAGLEHYARRGQARCFDTATDLTLVELAADALSMARPECRARWSTTLASLTADEVRELTADVPGLSEVARTFVVRLVEINLGRLQDACRDA